MNRCIPLPFFRFLMTLAVVLLWTSSASFAPAAAQTAPRQFPPTAQRGMLVVTAPPELLINGKPERLSPGARIKGPTNMMVMSAALVGSAVLVNYKRDVQGMVHEVWILTPEEALEKRAGMETVTNIVFESDASQRKTDDGKTPFNQLPRYSER
ncbi:MAG: hypothetical protein WCG50_09200 [Rhodoferax sp.]|uniref:hypothetical protein n=1 Tax=Rhodoferax sp. TaxID=50421 RepID=UPI0030184FB6